jgi:hypothetical protein
MPLEYLSTNSMLESFLDLDGCFIASSYFFWESNLGKQVLLSYSTQQDSLPSIHQLED